MKGNITGLFTCLSTPILLGDCILHTCNHFCNRNLSFICACTFVLNKSHFIVSVMLYFSNLCFTSICNQSTFACSTKPVRFAIGLPCTLENKENTHPYVIREDGDSDTSDGPIQYRDDEGSVSEESRLALKVARKESLSLKLSLRPDRQELINRNILQLQSDNERQEAKEAIGARLIRRLSMRPTQEELEERNILKSKKKNF